MQISLDQCPVHSLTAVQILIHVYKNASVNMLLAEQIKSVIPMSIIQWLEGKMASVQSGTHPYDISSQQKVKGSPPQVNYEFT